MTRAFLAAPGDFSGWYGKLPVVGDFVTRHLDGELVKIWDVWLSEGLLALQKRHPDAWQDAYLRGPAWHFIITPGFLPGALHAMPLAGVVVPSLDRVGRYYPLTVFARLTQIPSDRDMQSDLWTWLLRVEDAAIDAIQDDWPIEQFDAELRRIAHLPAVAAPVARSGESDPWAPLFAVCSGALGKCVWHAGVEVASAQVMVSDQLNDSVMALWRPMPGNEMNNEKGNHYG